MQAGSAVAQEHKHNRRSYVTGKIYLLRAGSLVLSSAQKTNTPPHAHRALLRRGRAYHDLRSHPGHV